ncbi:MAG: HVO_0476 family zinc finger protein [Methanobacteriaceae archaeon]|jgi:uncharacterized Zn finger protein|uniref:HVO_0476 family zinc finger protein n=1 Tax=unclassified Methanobrevibacter TaxID=2638681 RepID=UPI003766234B|nr:HVO_0476 family zinc finger protein [Methanobacteriaceae archaeon]
MECPICGSKTATILKTKKINSKKNSRRELLLKCENCGQVYNESIIEEKPQTYRLVISEHEDSFKTSVELFPDQELNVGDYLQTNFGKVEITSLETTQRRESHVKARDVKTIWANSKEIPARFGISVDLHGKVASFKVETVRDFKISVDDVFKIDNYIINVYMIKTEDRKTSKGFAKARVIKRVYGRPVNLKRYDYDLTESIVSKKALE